MPEFSAQSVGENVGATRLIVRERRNCASFGWQWAEGGSASRRPLADRLRMIVRGEMPVADVVDEDRKRRSREDEVYADAWRLVLRRI